MSFLWGQCVMARPTQGPGQPTCLTSGDGKATTQHGGKPEAALPGTAVSECYSCHCHSSHRSAPVALVLGPDPGSRLK